MKFTKYGFTSLDHMTHIDNLDAIFKYGLLSHNNPHKKVDISNQTVNLRRKVKEPIFGKEVHDYVPFYFNPRNAMMYKNRHENIVILAFSTDLLLLRNTLFTDRNASTNAVRFFHHTQNLEDINWSYLKSASWYEKPEIVKQIMMAEVLVPNKVSINYLKGIYCKDRNTKQMLMDRYNLSDKKVIIKPSLFFN